MSYRNYSVNKNMLSNKERKYLISKFPKVKPFYEKTLHNKVSHDNDENEKMETFYMCIPSGKKYFIWFTLLNNRPTCISLNYYFKTKSFQQIKKIPCNFDPILCSGECGTILYGTHVLLKQKNVFSVENIFYYKNKKVLFDLQFTKLNLIHDILNSRIASKIYLKREYLFKLPLIDSSFKNLKQKLSKLSYKVYCIQHRSWSKNTYVNEIIKINTKHYAVFSVTSELNTDVYSLYCLNANNLEKVGVAYIGTIKLSKFMNKLFRYIRENDDIDLIEESEDEDYFENVRDDKFVLNKTYNIQCIFNRKYNKWEPIKQTNEPVTRKQELVFFDM
tara:strand:- start:32 stop:1027 length:996 start_codon:yes stop_codon:yes gene_type:complete